MHFIIFNNQHEPQRYTGSDTINIMENTIALAYDIIFDYYFVVLLLTNPVFVWFILLYGCLCVCAFNCLAYLTTRTVYTRSIHTFPSAPVPSELRQNKTQHQQPLLPYPVVIKQKQICGVSIHPLFYLFGFCRILLLDEMDS